MAREVEEECEIDGYKIPRGANIMIFPWAIHHHPDVWEKPDEFNPERFNSENSKSRNPYAFIPFSAGPRNCIGQNFAISELKMVLATLIKRFKNHNSQ